MIPREKFKNQPDHQNETNAPFEAFVSLARMGSEAFQQRVSPELTHCAAAIKSGRIDQSQGQGQGLGVGGIVVKNSNEQLVFIIGPDEAIGQDPVDGR